MTNVLPYIEVPSPARAVIQLLEDAGFEAWCVGGFVRDAVMGRRPRCGPGLQCHLAATEGALR